MKHKSLGTITDKFSLKSHGRMDGNGRNYLLESVKAMINSDFYKERLKLGELFGYFGHNRRQFANKLDLDETEIIYQNGKPVVIENVPSNRTIELSVDDNGVVTHTQEILDTPSGRIVKAMVDSGAGGWSWAVNGAQTLKGAIAKTFHGFDFVQHPSYVNLDRQQAMFESTGTNNANDLLEMMLESQGIDAGQSQKISSMLINKSFSADEYDELLQDNMMLESILQSRQDELKKLVVNKANRHNMLLESIKDSQVFITEEQLNALSNLSSDKDLLIVKSFFESVSVQRPDLPLSPQGNLIKPSYQCEPEVMEHAVIFSKKQNPFVN